MSNALQIPDEAVKYILFQRTKFMKYGKSFPYRALTQLIPRFHNWAIGVESRLGKQRIKSLYSAEMEKEFLSLKPVLPATCAAFLDIGCGIAGVDAYLYQHYSPQGSDGTTEVYLLDKTELEDNIYYDFNDKTAFYNSLDLAKATLEGSGVPDEAIHLRYVTDNNDIEIEQPLNLILSLRSWGFHYPVETYLDRAYDRLASGGVLILDLAHKGGGQEQMQAKFGAVNVIEQGEFHNRVAAVKR